MTGPDNKDQKWIEDVELPDANVKWSFSNFAGAEDVFNAKGNHNFTLILPEETAQILMSEGWNVKVYEGREEGDPPEYTIKVTIGMKNEPPKMYLIKNGRKIRIENSRDLADIQRSTTERLDVIITPYRWIKGNDTGVSAYVKELYAKVKESSFESMYADLEEI